jgi:phosphoribosylamine---glycine ligase
VVLAADGYPESPRAGDPIEGLAEAAAVPGVRVLHAGTRLAEGQVVSAGGRVLSVVGTGEDLRAARDAAYAGLAEISLAGGHFRSDIALAAAQ